VRTAGRSRFAKKLAALQAVPVIFRVGPHGETGLVRFAEKYSTIWNGADLLRKLTLDLLQTEFAPKPVSPGESWKARGQFAYAWIPDCVTWISAALTFDFEKVVEVAAKPCAWVTSKYCILAT